MLLFELLCGLGILVGLVGSVRFLICVCALLYTSYTYTYIYIYIYPPPGLEPEGSVLMPIIRDLPPGLRTPAYTRVHTHTPALHFYITFLEIILGPSFFRILVPTAPNLGPKSLQEPFKIHPKSHLIFDRFCYRFLIYFRPPKSKKNDQKSINKLSQQHNNQQINNVRIR